jgi:hypothetical protein
MEELHRLMIEPLERKYWEERKKKNKVIFSRNKEIAKQAAMNKLNRKEETREPNYLPFD